MIVGVAWFTTERHGRGCRRVVGRVGRREGDGQRIASPRSAPPGGRVYKQTSPAHGRRIQLRRAQRRPEVIAAGVGQVIVGVALFTQPHSGCCGRVIRRVRRREGHAQRLRSAPAPSCRRIVGERSGTAPSRSTASRSAPCRE